MFLKCWNRKTKTSKNLPFTFNRDLPEGDVIVLKTDMDLDSDAILDFLAENYDPGIDVADLIKLNSELSQRVLKDEGGCSAIVVHEGSWEVFLTQDPDFEIEA